MSSRPLGWEPAPSSLSMQIWFYFPVLCHWINPLVFGAIFIQRCFTFALIYISILNLWPLPYWATGQSCSAKNCNRLAPSVKKPHIRVHFAVFNMCLLCTWLALMVSRLFILITALRVCIEGELGRLHMTVCVIPRQRLHKAQLHKTPHFVDFTCCTAQQPHTPVPVSDGAHMVRLFIQTKLRTTTLTIILTAVNLLPFNSRHWTERKSPDWALKHGFELRLFRLWAGLFWVLELSTQHIRIKPTAAANKLK